MIHVQVDPRESWAGMALDDGEFPGTYSHFRGGFNLIPERPA